MSDRMNRRRMARVVFFVAGVLLHSLAGGAKAQVPGLPYFSDPFRASSTVNHGLLLTVGHALDDEGEEGLASWTVGGRYRVADGVTVQGTAGLLYSLDVNKERSARPQLGAAWDVLLVRRTVTVALTNGIGFRAADGGNVFTIPVGLGAMWLIPVTGTGAGPKIGLWAHPRAELMRLAGDGESTTDLIWGLSVGGSIVISDGLGINLGADYREIPDPGGLALPYVPDWSWALMLRLRR